MNRFLRHRARRIKGMLSRQSLDVVAIVKAPGLIAMSIASGLLLAFALGRCSHPSALKTPEPAEAADTQPRTIAFNDDELRRAGLVVVRPELSRGTERPMSGFVEPAVGAQASIGMPISGHISRLLVAPGSRVRAGQAIAEVRSPEAAMVQAEAEAARASAQSLALQYKRIAPIAREGALAWQDAESKRIASVKAASEARAAHARVMTMGSPDAMGRLWIRTPIGGHIAAIKTSPGAVLQTGAPVAEVNNTSGNELRFMVSPLLGGSLQIGQRLRVRAGARELRARVVAIAPDAALGDRVMVVRARHDGDALPPAGTAVTAFVTVASREQRLTLPPQAVQLLDGRPVVFRYQRGAVEAVPVVIGQQSGDRIVILQGIRSAERLLAGNTSMLLGVFSKSVR